MVTSDRSIQNAVREYDARVQESSDFRIKVFETLKSARNRVDYLADARENPDISYDEYMEMLEKHEKNNTE